MKFIREKILYIVLLVIVILIAGLVILFINNKNKIEKFAIENIYGKWLVNSTQDFVNNEIYASNIETNNNYIIINKDTIEICYYKENDAVCEKSNYVADDNTITIDENEAYLSGINEIYMENGYLIFKRVLTKNEYVQMILERE